MRALASYALERASAGADAVVTARDVRSALDDVVSDRAASKRRRRSATRPGRSSRRSRANGRWTASDDRAEVLAFLEARAYDGADISLPLRRGDVDDLVGHPLRGICIGICGVCE